MSEIAFHDDYVDLSDSRGFQFESCCERCHDAWRAEFTRCMASTARDLLGTASSLLGGLFGGAETVADQISDARYRTAHGRAFA